MDDLTDKEAIEIIKETLQYGYVIPSTHAKERMPERGYTMADVRHILKNGKIIKREAGKSSPRYSIQGNDIDGDPGVVVIELDAAARKMVLVTVKGGVK